MLGECPQLGTLGADHCIYDADRASRVKRMALSLENPPKPSSVAECHGH